MLQHLQATRWNDFALQKWLQNDIDATLTHTEEKGVSAIIDTRLGMPGIAIIMHPNVHPIVVVTGRSITFVNPHSPSAT